MKSLFDPETYQEIQNRLNNLHKDSKPLWGKMTVATMLTHCQRPIQVALGELNLKKPPFLIGMLMKGFRKGLYNDRPWKKGMPTAKEFLVREAHEFNQAKTELETLITELYSRKHQQIWPTHPIFGSFSTEEVGKMQYKHLDHHLTQFGV